MNSMYEKYFNNDNFNFVIDTMNFLKKFANKSVKVRVDKFEMDMDYLNPNIEVMVELDFKNKLDNKIYFFKTLTENGYKFVEVNGKNSDEDYYYEGDYPNGGTVIPYEVSLHINSRKGICYEFIVFDIYCESTC